MDKINERKVAMQWMLQGQSPSKIIRNLQKSRQWFYKWLRRFRKNPTGEWYQEQSRRPNSIQRKITRQTEELVIRIRQQLEDSLYAQIGAVNIQWEMSKLGFELLPIWTINRILHNRHLVLKTPKEPKRKNEYPGDRYTGVHQMDLIGPLYLRSKAHFYLLNIIDTETHIAQVNPVTGKGSEGIVKSVIRFWKQYGLPCFLQMDNELSFHGSNRYPHSFGLLIRLIFSQDVQPIFIPFAEPWRNGIIEHFNHTTIKSFLRTQQFANFDDVCQKSLAFEYFHNEHHRYSAHQNHTPLQMFKKDNARMFLNRDYLLPEYVPLTEGRITLIRFIRSDRKLKIFGENFTLPSDTVYNYVIAVISVVNQSLRVYINNQVVCEFYYEIPVDWV